MARTARKDVALIKRTAMLREDQIEAISEKARENNREFSAELRTMIDRDLAQATTK